MMENKLQPGTRGELSILVTQDKSATAYGSGTVDVFATPAMVALMEQTAMKSVEAFLIEGHVTVGTEIHVSHLKATALGRVVRCQSLLVSIENQRLNFEVEVFDDQGVVGKGTHTRYIVDRQRFMSKV
jgi:predicted thioesterase